MQNRGFEAELNRIYSTSRCTVWDQGKQDVRNILLHDIVIRLHASQSIGASAGEPHMPGQVRRVPTAAFQCCSIDAIKLHWRGNHSNLPHHSLRRALHYTPDWSSMTPVSARSILRSIVTFVNSTLLSCLKVRSHPPYC